MKAVLCIIACLTGIAISWAQEPSLVRTLKGHRSSVNVVAFSPDSKLLASSQDGCEVRLWDVSTGKNLGVIYNRQYKELNANCCESLAFSPNGKILAGGIQGCWVLFWDVAKRAIEGNTETSKFFHRPSSIAFNPDGKTLVSLSCRGADANSDNQELVFTDVGTLKNTHMVTIKEAYTGIIAFSPDCRLFAMGRSSHDVIDGGLIALYETATGNKIATFQGHCESFLNSLTFSPDGKTLAVSNVKTVMLWDVATGKHMSTFTLSNPISIYPEFEGYFKNSIYCVAFHPNNNIIAFGNSGEPVVELWDVATGNKIVELKGNFLGKRKGIDSVAFSPDGKMLAAGRSMGGGNSDETIELWDIGSVCKLEDNSANNNAPVQQPSTTNGNKTTNQ